MTQSGQVNSLTRLSIEDYRKIRGTGSKQFTKSLKTQKAPFKTASNSKHCKAPEHKAVQEKLFLGR